MSQPRQGISAMAAGGFGRGVANVEDFHELNRVDLTELKPEDWPVERRCVDKMTFVGAI